MGFFLWLAWITTNFNKRAQSGIFESFEVTYVFHTNSSESQWHCSTTKNNLGHNMSDFQACKKKNLCANDNKPTSRSISVTREAAHRGESEWLVCFLTKVCKTNTRHFKEQTRLTPTYSKVATNHLWQASIRGNIQATTYWLHALVFWAIQWNLIGCFLNDVSYSWYHHRLVFPQGNLKPPHHHELTVRLNWYFSSLFPSFFPTLSLFSSLWLYLPLLPARSFSWRMFKNVCLQLCGIFVL